MIKLENDFRHFRMYRGRYFAGWIALTWSLVASSFVSVQAQQEEPAEASADAATVWQDSFEDERPKWVREEVDAPVDWLAHDRSDLAARDGVRSERFVFRAGPGGGVYVSYSVPKIVVEKATKITLNLRSNLGGMRVLARVVLPEDKDPDTGRPSFVVVAGRSYENVGVWQRLSIDELATEVESQARLLRIRSQRKVPTKGAYLERIVLNLYGGPNETTVYVDDLRITPVDPSVLATRIAQQTATNEDAAMQDPAEPKLGVHRVAIQGGQLRRDGLGWFFSLVDAPGADWDQLLRMGFDVLSIDSGETGDAVADATRMGFLLSPRIGQGRLVEDDAPANVIQRARKFPLQEAVAFWDVGQNLGLTIDEATGQKQLERNRNLVRAIHDQAAVSATQGRPFADLVSGMVAGRFAGYAIPQNHLEMMAVDPTIWSSTKPHSDVLAYLQQRKDLTTLANPAGILFWGWVSARGEPAAARQLWGFDPPPIWGQPRRQPEQLRIDTYLAMASGFRGIGVRSDADLTRAAGRPLLLELGFLNEEIDLVEAILSDQQGPIQPIMCFPPDPPMQVSRNGLSGITSKNVVSNELGAHPSIRGSAINLPEKRGRLVMIADLDEFAQWQPPQMSLNNLTVRIPGTPENATAYLISPGEVRVLERRRVPGGLQLVVPEFDTTAMILLTTDDNLAEWTKAAVARNRAMASAMAIEQAELQLAWATEVHNRLANDGIGLAEAGQWQALCMERIASARDSQAREDFAQAWAEARRALRPLRIMMRDHWMQGYRYLQEVARYNLREAATPDGSGQPSSLPALVPPMASPGLVAFNTLPQHYLWCSWIRDGKFTDNSVLGGSFDDPNEIRTAGWINLCRQSEGRSGAAVSAEGPGGQGRVLRLNVSRRSDARIDELAAFVDNPVAMVRTHPIKVNPREMIRIRVKVRMPRPQQPGAGGVVVEDSLGGPALAFRSSAAVPEWSEVVLYRRVVDETSMTVKLGLAGDGDAFFDDLRVERLTENAPIAADRIAAAPAGSTPAQPAEAAPAEAAEEQPPAAAPAPADEPEPKS
ncbi:hypothetical protein GC170_19485 [bacterium]|nr:hypothetical protein [bacterium]